METLGTTSNPAILLLNQPQYWPEQDTSIFSFYVGFGAAPALQSTAVFGICLFFFVSHEQIWQKHIDKLLEIVSLMYVT